MPGLDCHLHGSNRIASGSMWGKVTGALRMAAAMGGLIGVGVLLDVADGICADPQPVDMKTLLTFQPGEVSANHGQEILIDHKRYSVLSSVSVMDDEGNPRSLKEIVPGIFVRFHVRNDQIDTIVMILPK